MDMVLRSTIWYYYISKPRQWYDSKVTAHLKLRGAITATQLEAGKGKHMYPHVFKPHENQTDVLHLQHGFQRKTIAHHHGN